MPRKITKGISLTQSGKFIIDSSINCCLTTYGGGLIKMIDIYPDIIKDNGNKLTFRYNHKTKELFQVIRDYPTPKVTIIDESGIKSIYDTTNGFIHKVEDGSTKYWYDIETGVVTISDISGNESYYLCENEMDLMKLVKSHHVYEKLHFDRYNAADILKALFGKVNENDILECSHLTDLID